MKAPAKNLCAEAKRLGYEHTGVNSKGFLVYAHPAGHEVRISPSATEHQAREISKAMRQAAGTYEATTGRNAVAVKERAQKRRELDAERLSAERRAIQAEHDAYLARISGAPHLEANPAALRRIEEYLRRLDHIDSLMRSIPSGGDHQGRRSARHTAGKRDGTESSRRTA